jgi:hypothetical protein
MSTSLAVGVLEELEQLQQPQRYRPISILHSIAFCIIPHPSLDARTIYAEQKNALSMYVLLRRCILYLRATACLNTK